jgi:hypothetical protein
MQFPYPIVRVLKITNANGTTAIQIGPGPTATWYGQNGSQLIITADQSQLYPTIQFWNANHNNMAFINMYGSNSDANLGINSGGFPSIRYPTITNAQVTILMATNTRSFFATVESAPGQLSYGGAFNADETSAINLLYDSAENVVATSGVVDFNSSGAPFPVVEAIVGSNGMYVDNATVQFKGTVNEAYPVEWEHTNRWLIISQFDWTPLILINNWAQASTYLLPSAKMMPDGVVVLAGTIRGGTTTDNTQVAATPFTSMSPTASALVHPAVSVASGNARLLINTSGQIFCYGMAAGTDIGLDGLQFRCKRP